MWYSDFISFYYSTIKTSELWEGHVYTAICKMDNQQRPVVWHIELCSTYVSSWMEWGFGGERIHVCI